MLNKTLEIMAGRRQRLTLLLLAICARASAKEVSPF